MGLLYIEKRRILDAKDKRQSEIYIHHRPRWLTDMYSMSVGIFVSLMQLLIGHEDARASHDELPNAMLFPILPNANDVKLVYLTPRQVTCHPSPIS